MPSLGLNTVLNHTEINLVQFKVHNLHLLQKKILSLRHQSVQGLVHTSDCVCGLLLWSARIFELEIAVDKRRADRLLCSEESIGLDSITLNRCSSYCAHHL